MVDFLDTLAQAAKARIDGAYYEDAPLASTFSASLKQAIIQSTTAAIIAEIKGASPSEGTIKEGFAPDEIARAMARGGAIGISVLTEPKYFCGSLGYLAKVRTVVNLPLLMKDIIVSTVQLDAAARAGANAVLFIQALFDRGYCECNAEEMISKAHERDLEVLLETRNQKEFRSALRSDADLVGINNRNLGTLEIDLDVTRNLLETSDCRGKAIVSESGIRSPEDIRFLSRCGAQAFLIGSIIMMSANTEQTVKELVEAL